MLDEPKECLRGRLTKDMSQRDQNVMRQWAQEHGKAVRQQTVRQCTTKHSAGTLPLNMYQKELPIGERVTLEYSDQQSEYDSGSGEEEGDSSEDQEEVTPPDLNNNAINFLSRTIRTRQFCFQRLYYCLKPSTVVGFSVLLWMTMKWIET